MFVVRHWYIKHKSTWYMYEDAVHRGLTIERGLIDIHVGMKLLGLRQSTSTHSIVAMLTAKTGPHEGSSSGLYNF